MIALGVIVALILYASLYPWRFAPNPYAELDLLFMLWPPLRSPRLVADAVANVLFYVPLGLAARHAFGLRRWAVVLAFLLSATCEYAQMFIPGRVANSFDLSGNTIGGAIGAAVPVAWHRLRPVVVGWRTESILLLPVWLVSLYFPLIPLLSAYGVREKVPHFFVIGSTAATAAALQWFLGAELLRDRGRLWMASLVLLVPAQFFFLDIRPTLGGLLGAMAGCALAMVFPSVWVAFPLLILSALAPFRLSGPYVFSWIPFADSIDAGRDIAVAIFAGKCFVYGGVLSLAGRAWTPLRATAALAAVLIATEFCQIWISGRTPSTTDPALAAVIGLVMVTVSRLSDEDGRRPSR